MDHAFGASVSEKQVNIDTKYSYVIDNINKLKANQILRGNTIVLRNGA